MSEERLELVVDSHDDYLDSKNVYYIHPKRLSMVRTVQDGTFSSGLVQNTECVDLTSSNFAHIIRKLKVNATLEILVEQPLSVMQSYDAKTIEANAKLAGFADFYTQELKNYVNPRTNKKQMVVRITCVKPEKNPNLIKVETRTSVVRGKVVSKQATKEKKKY